MPPSSAPLSLITEGFPAEPGLDTAISSVLLEDASDRGGRETLRLYRPGNVVAFGRQDVASAGYPQAVAAARSGGFAPIERLAGGRAAVFTPNTLAFAWAIPAAEPKLGTESRFLMVAGLFRDALAALGVDAQIGEVEGEYCPGRFSVNEGGVRKLMGVGQRLKRHAAHVGGVVVIDDAASVNAILEPVYAAMSLSWQPAATGAVSESVPGVTLETVSQAFLAELSKTRTVIERDLDDDVVQRGRRRAPELMSP